LHVCPPAVVLDDSGKCSDISFKSSLDLQHAEQDSCASPSPSRRASAFAFDPSALTTSHLQSQPPEEEEEEEEGKDDGLEAVMASESSLEGYLVGAVPPF